MSTRCNVLIVEEAPDVASALKRQIEALCCHVEVALSGEIGVILAQEKTFDLIILDVMLPGSDGLELCRRVRAGREYTPVLMVSGRRDDIDRVGDLEMGAEEYMTRRYSAAELVARVRSLFRCVDALCEQVGKGCGVLRFGDALTIDPESREVTVRGKPVVLTHKEYELLRLFVRNPGRVYSRGELLEAVWGDSHDAYDHAVECHINRLRAKIDRDPGRPKLLQTVWGVGYKLSAVE
jgi:DNA-binding response OmpR family regulator